MTDGDHHHIQKCDRQTNGQTDERRPLPYCPLPFGGVIYQCIVSFNSLLYFQRNAADKLFIAKIKKGSSSINTGDRVIVLAFCNSLHGPLSVYQVSFIYLQYF